MSDRHPATDPATGLPSAGPRRLLYLVLVIFIALHQDFWGWHDAGFVLGLPSGLTYHFFYCLAAAGLMALLVRFAWPRDLVGDDGPEGGR